ncbi:MAG: kelch repeat-containing protein, partial [Anaeromyxobacteraceae bacterium]
MTAASSTRKTLAALALLSLAVVPTTVRAQVPGENVNMVTGTQWPGGDPFLQRQNEPSLAVSSANPQHLLAGANDYRSVDVPYPFGPNDPMKMPGDAWLGVFKSMNGGQTWQSVLMPGFPQDSSPLPSQGPSSPLRNCVKGSTAPSDRCTSAADPVVRAGTDGMLYFSGIAFKRGTSWGKVFLSRFIDLNNKENGDPTRTDPADPTKANPTDPIRFVDQVVVASSDGQVFLDKPWIAVDKPRLLAQMCKVTTTNPDGTITTRAFPGGAIYMSWVKFAPGEVTSDVMFSSSRDCGKTWTAAIKLNDATTSLNQAPTIAIDPFTGFVYVAWRRMAYPAAPAVPTQKDAIVVARSFRGFLFTKPRVIAEFTPFEQGSTTRKFRTHAFPSIAVSVDKSGYNGWVHVAWPQRMPPFGDSRVVVATAPVLPPPANGLESGDPCNGWSVPMQVDEHAINEPWSDGVTSGWRTFTRGHQFMPSLTFSQGKLVVVYYDSRLTHTANTFEPNSPFEPDPMTGSFYRTERIPITPWDPRTGGGDPEPPPNLFAATNDEIDDAKVTNVRHTVEVRVGTSPPGKDPVFSSVQISKYRFGERGDEPPNFKVPRLVGTDSATATVTSRADGLPITTQDSFLRLQQFDVNPPNLPMFKNGTVPFIGDYIDVQGPAFVRKSSGWAFATEPSPAPVFHAVWTTNQDVRPPADGDWTHYTPMKLPGQAGTIFDGATAATARAYCTPGTPANEGTRNQNIYTARITEGLLVDSPQNVKPLSPVQTRSFVVVARNDTAYPKAFRFSFTGVAPAGCAVAAGQAGPTSCATFSADGSVPAVDVEILPHSSATRSLFVRSASVGTTITVNVNEIVRPGPVAPPCSLSGLTCAYVPGGLSGFVTLNPPGSSPSLVPPDGSATGAGTNETITFANVSTANVSTANVSTANVSTANVSTANISTANVSTANVCTANVSTANVSTANVSTANVSTANVTTANISTANVSTANVSTANVSTANVSTANVSTANVSTANVSTANVSTAPVSDLNYEVTNTSNTTTTYGVQFICSDPAGCPTQEPLHLMVNKFYVVPASIGCQLVAEPRNVLVANGGYVQGAFVRADSIIDPQTREGAASNATVSLAPGEKAQITLRGRVSLAEMAAIGTKLVPAVLPHGTPRGGSVGGTQTYATTSTFGLPSVATQTALTAAGNTYTATVVGVPASTGVPSGKVTFIANGGTMVGVGPLDVAGKAVLTASLPAGTTLVAYYGGDSRFKASSGSIGQKLATSLRILVDGVPPSAPGQTISIGFRLTAPIASPSPTGAVQLYDGDYTVGAPRAFTCQATTGAQECSGVFPVAPSPGGHSFWAAYPGDAGYLESGTSTLAWSVSNATVTVTPPAGIPLIGQAATFTASVTNATSQAVTWNVSPAGAAIDPLGTFVASAPGTYTVTATSAVDPAATGSASVTIAAPTIRVNPGGPDTIGMLTTETLLLGAAVTGIASPVVSWSILPVAAGVSVTPAVDTLSATFAATAAGTFVVTARAGGVSATATIAVSLPAVASPFGISGAVNDGFVNVAVNRDFAAYNDATVTVTGAGGAVVDVPRVGNGQYQTTGYVLPATGQAVTVTVSGSSQTATATAVVPERPVITSPAQDAVLLAANPVTVTWTSASSPDDYAFDGWCGNGQCVAGVWTTVPGTDRSVTFNGGFFPAGQTVQMGLYAYNRMALSGAALPASSLVVNNKAPSPQAWWTFLVTETTAGGLVRARQNHVAVLLGGSVYSVGGNSTGNAPVASVERYDPVARTSTLVASMLEPRAGHGAVAVGGKIYAFGGAAAAGRYTASAEVYDPAANTWTPIASLPVARFNFRAAAIGNRIYALGGFSETGAHDRVDVYDVGSGAWTFLGTLAHSRTSFALGAAGSELLAIGGYESVSPQGPVTTMEILAGAAPGTLVPGPSVAVSTGPSAASTTGAIFVVGGSSQSVLQILDPATRTFSAPPSSWVAGAGAPLYANPVSYAGTATDGSRLFVTGGWPNTSSSPATTITDVPLPPAFAAPAQAASTIAAGGDSSFFAGADGPAFSWGQNNGGQLGSGVGIGVISPIPSPITGITAGVRSLDAANWYGMAVDRVGSLWVWGYGPVIGQAAIDNPVPIDYTAQLGSGTTVKAISAGYNGGLALRSDGAVFGFGIDAWGQLGPVTGLYDVRQIPGLSGIVAVSAGEHHTLALDSTGHVWSLGENTDGQLGVDPAILSGRSIPAVVQGLSGVVAIAAGSWHSVALKSDGTVWTWGHNAAGQLGNGGSSPSALPAPVPGLSGVKAIATGNNHTLAILADGTVRSWGYNQFGQLGDGTTTSQVSPVAVTGLTGIVEVSGGEWHSLARGAGGEIYAWGRNHQGQLGAIALDASPLASRVPMGVVSPTTATLWTGQPLIFSATVAGGSTGAVAWSVTPATGATISATGTFQATAPGTYAVTATSVADPSASASATVTVNARPALVLDATAKIVGAPPAAPGTVLTGTVTGPGGMQLPAGDVFLKVSTAANPGNVTTVPLSGPVFFSASMLPFTYGDTLLVEVVHAELATGYLVSSTRVSVVVPGLASLTSGTTSGGSASVNWSYGGTDPQAFWLWWTGAPASQALAGNLRTASFTVPFTEGDVTITSVNASATFTGNGSGTLTALSSDERTFHVAPSAPPPNATWTQARHAPTSAYLGDTITLAVGVEGSLSLPRPSGDVQLVDEA